jgi:hypothetical protein
MSGELTFDRLIGSIEEVHRQLSRQAKVAVNVSLTLRNWLIGAYMVEYEQGGADRAEYGTQLVERVAERLGGLTRTSARELRRFRSLYLVYPQIGATLSPELRRRLPAPLQPIWETPTPKSQMPGDKLLRTLSFSHLDALLKIEEPEKRRFYEQRCVQATWSVRELSRSPACTTSGRPSPWTRPGCTARPTSPPSGRGLGST